MTPAHWRSRGPLAVALWPLSLLYRALSALDRARYRWGWARVERSPVPLWVVGNWIAGGAGKTPVLMALVELLRREGWTPGVISRGYGRASRGVQLATAHSDAAQLGDEPLLIHRRTGAPLAVGERRAQAARALCAAHPQVDLILSDDGLQHHALAREVELALFDARGLGNGWLLPAGPLRQDRWHAGTAARLVLYTEGVASTPLPGPVAQRGLQRAWPLDAWWRGEAQAAVPLGTLRGRALLACAGLAQPERFFTLLRQQGLTIRTLALPDHATFDPLPWPADTAEVLVTEKDAVKLDPARLGALPRVWVCPLDLRLPDDLTLALRALLPPRPHGPPTH